MYACMYTSEKDIALTSFARKRYPANLRERERKASLNERNVTQRSNKIIRIIISTSKDVCKWLRETEKCNMEL